MEGILEMLWNLAPRLLVCLLFTVAAVLILACGLLVTWGFLRVRDSMKAEIEVLAGVMGSNSTAGGAAPRSAVSLFACCGET